MSFNLTLISCVHNPDDSFYNLVLNAITNLEGDYKYLEYIIIDNNSNPPILNSDIYEKLFNKINWTLVKENNPGLTNARKRGILSANYDTILFVDDDVVLQNDYIKNINYLFNKYPFCGAWNAGKIDVKYLEPHLNSWFYSEGLEYFQQSDIQGSIYHNDPTGFFPFGTGLVIRRDVCLKYLENCEKNIFTLTDRYNAKLSSGGDNQLVLVAILNDFAVGRSCLLKLDHLVSEKKSKISYLKKLTYGQAFSQIVFLFENPKFIFISKPYLFYFKNLIIYLGALILNFDLKTFLIRLSCLKGVWDANGYIKVKKLATIMNKSK